MRYNSPPYIDHERSRYEQALQDVKDKKISKVESDGRYNVSYNAGPNQGMQGEDFDTYAEAEKYAKGICRMLHNEHYADKEDYPTITQGFKVTYNDGKVLYDHDTIVWCTHHW